MKFTALSRFTSGLFLASASVALSTGAPAQDGDVLRLDRVEVGGEAVRGSATAPVNGYVAGRTATGSKSDTPIEEIPQSISVIGRQEMDDRGAGKADEALRYTAGVFAQPFGPDSDTDWLFIRGFQATGTGAYQDGLQNYSYGFGGFFTDSFLLERIEVLRGAASVLYGGSNPGGLVNYVTKRANGERIRHVEAGIDNSGTAYTGFDLGDSMTGDLSYRLVGRIAGGDGATDFAEGFRGTVSPSLTWDAGKGTRLSLSASYTHIDETHNGGSFLPYVGTVRAASFGRIDRDSNFTEPDIDTYDRRQYTLGYQLAHAFANGIELRQNFRYGHAYVHEISLYPYGYLGFATAPTDAAASLTRINFEHKTRTDTALLDNQVQATVRTGPLEHTLLAGVDYKFFRMDQMQATGSATAISAFAPVYGAAQGERSAYIDQILTMHQIGFYAQDQIRFGDGWIVTLNGRHDRVSTEGEGQPSYKDSTGKSSGRAGIAYTFSGGLTPYASVATFFDPQIGSSLATGFNKPESGRQIELGIKYTPAWMDGLLTAAVFDLERRNVLTGPFLAESQIGEVRSRGFEAEAKANVTRELKATAAFTAFDLEITKDADASIIGKTPYIVPETQASLWLDYTFRDGPFSGVGIGGGVRYVGSSWADEANTRKVPAATVFDARLGYQRDGWGADVIVTNLFDRTYVASCQTEYTCSYAAGRVAKLKVHFDW